MRTPNQDWPNNRFHNRIHSNLPLNPAYKYENWQYDSTSEMSVHIEETCNRHIYKEIIRTRTLMHALIVLSTCLGIVIGTAERKRYQGLEDAKKAWLQSNDGQKDEEDLIRMQNELDGVPFFKATREDIGVTDEQYLQRWEEIYSKQ